MLWAGCVNNRPQARPGGPAEKPVVLDWQENLSRPHVDTRPEWRLGMNMAFPHPPHPYPRAIDLGNAVDQPEI
jgi:hypothetical protein